MFLNLPPCPHNRGKINSVKYFIKHQSRTDYESLDLYLEHVELLKKLVSRSSMNELEDIFYCGQLYLYKWNRA